MSGEEVVSDEIIDLLAGGGFDAINDEQQSPDPHFDSSDDFRDDLGDFLCNDLEFVVFVRQFKGQTSGSKVGTWKFSCHSAEDVAEKVCNEGENSVFHDELLDC